MTIEFIDSQLLSIIAACRHDGLDWRWLEKRLADAMVVTGMRRRREPGPVAKAQFFEDFWRIYPRKIDKAGCLRKWEARDLDAEVAIILQHVARNAEGQDWNKDGCKYCPMPATYLNQRRWEGDEGNVDPFGLEGAL